jgi:hypothetical protein
MELTSKIEGTNLRFRLEGTGGNEFFIILEKKTKLFGLFPVWERVGKHSQSIDTDRADAMHKYNKFTKVLYESYNSDKENSGINHSNFVASFPESFDFSSEQG